MRREFSRKTKAARFEHCKGLCERCGAKLRPGRFHYDHVKPTGWLAGDASFENCECICAPCHREKTGVEAAAKAKGDRLRDKAIGALKSRNPLPGGRQSPWKRKMDGTVVRRD
jgi:hypothetical protein